MAKQNRKKTEVKRPSKTKAKKTPQSAPPSKKASVKADTKTAQEQKAAAVKKTPSTLQAPKKGASAKSRMKDQTLVKSVVAEIVDDTTKPLRFKNSTQEKAGSISAVEREIDDESESEDLFAPDDSAYHEEENLGGEAPELIAKDTESSQVPAPIGSKALTTADPIVAYMAEVRKYPLLTKEKEIELTKKYYDTKDPLIAQILVTSNLRFVVKIAAEYSKFGARLIDLIQEGNMGLMHGVREFNPYKGVRLITYAVWWIRGYIQEYLMKQYSLVKIGTTQNQKKLFYQLQRQKAELDAMGKTPDIKTLSEKLGIPEDEVQMMANRMSGRDISLDRPLDEESGARAMDLQKGDLALPDEELARQEELSYLHQTIESLKPSLTEREKIILDERILADEPLTLQEIGEKYGITREAVRQMEVRLMKKIKETFEKTQSTEEA